jgi:WD40 repeat protein
LWDVIKQVCIHAFDPQLWGTETIFFSPGDNIQCNVVTRRGKMIRIVRNKRMEFAATIHEPSLGNNPLVAVSPCGTCFAAISYIVSIKKWELALFDLKTMAKTQSVAHGHIDLARIAMSPDGKKLVTTNIDGGIQLIECHDLTIRKKNYNVKERPAGVVPVPRRWPVAIDPTGRFFAVERFDGRVELRAI